jgi:hypothetical protein
MLYVGAVDSTRHVAPKQIYKMSNEQAALVTDAARIEYSSESKKAGFVPRGNAWYADNSREPIRDETLRQGLIPVGAVLELKNLPTTSSKPRYSLAADFAALFDPILDGDQLTEAIKKWQQTHLSAGALARMTVIRAGAAKDPAAFVVTFPNGETRQLVTGDSSIIAKAVVEKFATRFLEQPAVIWLSESGHKVVARDDILAKQIGITIDVARDLPDIILADVGGDDVLLVFVEVVATDGPISTERRESLLQIARNANLDEQRVAFVTAYMDRDASALRKTFAALAWNTFVWLASEPDNIIALHGAIDGAAVRLRSMLKTKP